MAGPISRVGKELRIQLLCDSSLLCLKSSLTVCYTYMARTKVAQLICDLSLTHCMGLTDYKKSEQLRDACLFNRNSLLNGDCLFKHAK